MKDVSLGRGRSLAPIPLRDQSRVQSHVNSKPTSDHEDTADEIQHNNSHSAVQSHVLQVLKDTQLPTLPTKQHPKQHPIAQTQPEFHIEPSPQCVTPPLHYSVNHQMAQMDLFSVAKHLGINVPDIPFPFSPKTRLPPPPRPPLPPTPPPPPLHVISMDESQDPLIFGHSRNDRNVPVHPVHMMTNHSQKREVIPWNFKRESPPLTAAKPDAKPPNPPTPPLEPVGPSVQYWNSVVEEMISHVKTRGPKPSKIKSFQFGTGIIERRLERLKPITEHQVNNLKISNKGCVLYEKSPSLPIKDVC